MFKGFLLLHFLARTCAYLCILVHRDRGRVRRKSKMSSKRSKGHHPISTTSTFLCEASEACRSNDISTSQPLVDPASSPGPTQRPIIKEEPGETKLVRTEPTRKATVEDVQPYTPKWLQNSWGGGQEAIPGVRGQTH